MDNTQRYFLVVVKYDKDGKILPTEPCDIVKSWDDSLKSESEYKSKYRTSKHEPNIYRLRTVRWLKKNNIIPEVFEQVTHEPSTVYQIKLFRLANEVDFAFAWIDKIGNSTINKRMDFIHALQEKGFKITKQR